MKNIATLDALDRKIVRALQADASISNADLADRVGSTGPSCWRRIRLLEDAGILKATVRLADAAALGLSVNILCDVRMQSHESRSIESFENFVSVQTRIMECFRMTGAWDYSLRVVALDVADYEQFLMRELLKHPSVATASSRLALSMTKYETALPIRDRPAQ